MKILNETQYVVIVGNMIGNKTIHGPFVNDEHARQWILDNHSIRLNEDRTIMQQHCEVVPLKKI